jgi:hypothetical protein
MLKIEIKIDDNDKLKILRAVGNVVSAVKFQENELPRKMSIEYVMAIRQNIASGFYSFTSYSKEYKKWKDKNFGGEPFWKLSGNLMTHVKSFKTNDGWMGGVPEGTMERSPMNWGMNRSTLHSVVMYGKVIEEGGPFKKGGSIKKSKARPLFWNTLYYFSFNQSPIYGEKALTQIAKEWK